MLRKQSENFIIPFIYQNTYEDICGQMKNDQYFREIKELKETELHAFINRRFWQEESGHCGIFCVDENYGKDVLLSLYDTKQNIDIKITDIKYYIFKSGIMFLVISAKYSYNKGAVSLNAAEETNNVLKNLYLQKKRFVLLDKRYEIKEAIDENLFSDELLSLELDGNESEGIQKIKLSGIAAKDTGNGACVGEKISINNEVEVLKKISETKTYHIDMEASSYVKIKGNVVKCYKQGDFCLNHIWETINKRLNIKYSNYLASGKKTYFPKKAIVFNMHVLDNDDSVNVDERLYYFSHGYNRSYKYPKEKADMITTFANSYWKVTREGIANINLIGQGDEDHFLLQNFTPKFDTVYLWMFLLVLHQYYGLQYFSCKLLQIYQESLMIEKNGSRKEYKELLEQMEEIKNDGDLFMLQYTFSDVSQISHQNDIYMLICEKLHINGLIEDYKINADICSKILEKKQQNALSNKVNIIAWASGFFAVFTAVTDIISTLLDIGSTSLVLLWGIIGTSGVVLLVAGIIFLLKHTKDRGKEKNDKGIGQ